MTVFVGLLRAINVGGTGKLAMSELRELCESVGFARARTYIQSGNVVFESDSPEIAVLDLLEDALAVKMDKKVDVVIRSADELTRVLDANPFSEAQPSKVAVVLGKRSIRPDVLEGIVAPGGEQLALGNREIYVHYPDGMGRSKLKLPNLHSPVTVRNINTVTRLVAMASE